MKKYDKVPLPDDSESQANSFHTVHVDMIGPWTVKFTMLGNTMSKEIYALTMVDKATN